ncbi:hypothetical protein G7B40_031885 [Aetokthonos hydrillicola Thurmond2011]|jgi:hypothetical protein|uniref:Uncharacterized protein n=1 Tax=Aetokthonos hydrillicola Thurmond2011 TaxID=2712845 RepID=A0AAP5IFD2_9CYAN|nr:hypothetical protein [Aetokthonos hydrillicola]MBO3461293.1 hypothetical protein [Aetokthonos hydrillicola CCALA 1050]MBW4589631.1 hypothetical protein [Aetokthonos hydrillicola CCALA 1050]MDR9899127.1 hypothetical protein [Aetokthonos hydrillicola Thurmond2011]
MNQSTVNKSSAKNVCKHKANDNWVEGCCGQDLLAQKNFSDIEEQEKDSINTVKAVTPGDQSK